jgi:phenylacetate-coenzyme A ligase PaaK-like adenylate-forming protein
LLVTTLTNRTIPIVRYELTDIVALTTEPCRCGLPFARLESIEGRREELLRFPKRGGGMVDVHAGRLSSPLLRMEAVRQFQFSQVPEKGLEIAIALVPGFDPERTGRDVESVVRATLDKLDAIPAVVRVRLVDTIERVGTGSKMKLVAKSRPDPTS